MKRLWSVFVKGCRYLKHYGIKDFYNRYTEKKKEEKIPYDAWYRQNKTMEEQLKKQEEWYTTHSNGPKISIVVPLYQTPELFLREMIDSVRKQSYGNWQLCLADGSREADIGEQLKELCREDTRIQYCHLEKNEGIAGNTNAAIAMAEGDWIAFFDHDDLLEPDALYEAVQLMEKEPDCDMIYTDEDKVNGDRTRYFAPHFKPDFNRELLRANNYITHFLLVKAELIKCVGGIRKEFEGAQDFDFILRCSEKAKKICHIPKILYHWRTHELSTADNPFSKQYAIDAGKRAIEAHLKRCGEEGTAVPLKHMGFFQVQYDTGKEASFLQQKSGVLYSVIIADAEAENGNRKVYEKMFAGEGVEVLFAEKTESANNLAGAYNKAARLAKGEYVIFTTGRIKQISEGWQRMITANMKRDAIGLLSVRLACGKKIAGAGMIWGRNESGKFFIKNLFSGMKINWQGYMHKAALQQEYSLAPADFFVVRRDLFEKMGGFDETYPEYCYITDFCLRLQEERKKILYLPTVTATIREQMSVNDKETERLEVKWQKILGAEDPYYNRNLSAAAGDYSLKWKK